VPSAYLPNVMKKGTKSVSGTLRQKAESLLKKKTSKMSDQLSETETLKLIHELEVHQLELELQNEELTLAKERAELAVDKYTELYDFSPSGYFTLSQRGEIIELNLKASQMLGKDRAHLINRPLGFFISDKSKPIYSIFLQKVFFAKTTETCEITLSSDVNRPVYLHLSGIADNSKEKCMITAVDITDYKEAEAQLLMVKKAVESASDAIGISDAQGHHIYHNRATSELFGYATAEELEAAGGGTAVVRDPEVAREMFDTIMKGIPWSGELEMVTKSGRIFPAYERADAIIDKEGKIAGLIGVITDITERKMVERKLLEAKEHAEESDHLKSAFLANMSHEIRTPMNGVLGFAELLREPKLSGEEQEKYIDIIQRSGTRLLHIINDIIDISKIEAGQMRATISETNVNEKIEDTYNFFKQLTNQKGIHFSFKNPLTSAQSIIKSDGEKLYAILTNLVNNAIKFTHSGFIELGYVKKDGLLEFFVKDSGIGVNQSQKEIIFERFRQGGKQLTRTFEGTGLGLSISKAYVEMLGGKIWVESEEGQGSTFYFSVPYITEKQVQRNNPNILPAKEEPGQIKNLKILIAEDDESSDFLITSILNKKSHKLLHAATSVETIAVCRNNPDLDLVLMDIRMPDISGIEATRQIRQFNKGVIIIAQTAYALAGDRENAISAGCTDYISKPINRDELEALIHKYFKI